MKFADIGFGNLVSVERIVSVVDPDSLPVKTMIGSAREQGLLIDATRGRKTAGVLVADSGHVILSYYTPQRLVAAMAGGEENE